MSTVRPLVRADLDRAREIFEAAFDSVGETPPGGWTARHRELGRSRLERALASDPAGCLAAEARGTLAGVAVALRRGPVWVLSLLCVDPWAHGVGAGRALLDASLDYADGTGGQLICSSNHPAALRLYGTSGFRLRPCLEARGRLDRSLLPALPDVRDGGPEDLERTAAVDARVRGAARVEDLAGLLEGGGRLFLHPRGYALAREGACLTLAAHDEEAARRLLWRALAEAHPGGEAVFEWITAEQGWAMQVALAARLDLRPDGCLCTRGRLGPLSPFLPNGALL